VTTGNRQLFFLFPLTHNVPRTGAPLGCAEGAQYFSPKTRLPCGYHWSIEVNILADNVAVATYTFRWYATSMFETAMVTTSDKAVRDGRGTQVFVLDPDGKLRIVHEHLSDIWRDSSFTK
jgi:hypothetical protein